VAIFFCLSGFLIAKSLLGRGSLIEFATARALRIYPGIIVANLLTVGFAALFLTTLPVAGFLGSAETWKYLLLNSSLVRMHFNLPGVFLENHYPRAVNGSLWSLKFEMFMYAVTFAAGLLGLAIARGRPRSGPTLACLVVLFATLFAAIQGWIPGIRGSSGTNGGLAMSCFAAGALCFAARRLVPLHGLGAILAIAAITATGGGPLAVPVLAFGLTYTCLWLAFTPHLDAHGFARRGDFSYGMYIYAFPVQQTLYGAFPVMSPATNFATATVLTLGLAALSWHLVERRAMAAREPLAAFLARRFTRRDQRAATA
jgi:peptidoglycan/LPS O-acetylase OafA/YrhL